MCRDLKTLERSARDALSTAYGHDLSDEEWANAKSVLLEFGKLLRDWNTRENNFVCLHDSLTTNEPYPYPIKRR